MMVYDSVPESGGIDLRRLQLEVYHNPARFRMLVAGRRFGKSRLAMAEAMRAAMPIRRNVWYVAPTYNQAKSIAWERLKTLTKPYWKGRPSETGLSIRLRSESTVTLKGVDRPDTLRGSGLDFVVLDEFASIGREVWTKVLRPALSDREGRALFIGTPQGCNHFFDMYQDAQTTAGWATFQFTTAQGGNVSADELAAAAVELDPETFKQEFEADFTDSSRHKVYYAFKRATHVQAAQFDPALPLIWSMDFNVNPMCMVLLQRRDYHVYALDEIIVRPDANTEAACKAFHERVQKYRLNFCLKVDVYGDASGAARRTSATATDWALVRQFFKMHVGTYEPNYWIASVNPFIRDRVNCVNSRLCNALGEIRLLVDPKCKELIRDFETVTWARDASGRPTNDLDKTDRNRTHTSDALGYYISQVFHLRSSVGPQSAGRVV